MKKGVAVFLLLTVLTLSMQATVLAADMGYSDVAFGAWYYEPVQWCRDTGIMIGTGENAFSPDARVSMEQGIAIIARLHCTYYGEKLPNGEDWFAPCYDYLLAQNIISETEYVPETLMSREQFVTLLSRVYPREEFPAINEIAEIPAYDKSGAQYENVLTLYRAGILTGTTADGRFSPYKPITRAEIAALLYRVMCSDARVRFALTAQKSEYESIPLDIDAEKLEVVDFDGEFIIVRDRETFLCTVLDLSGGQVLPWVESVSPASDGVFFVTEAVGSRYYTTEGKLIDMPLYGEKFIGTDFGEGYACIQKLDDDQQPVNELYLMDKTGKLRLLSTEKLGHIHGGLCPSGGYVRVTDANGWCLLRISDGKLFPMKNAYEVSSFRDGLCVANQMERGDRLYNTELKPMLPENEIYTVLNSYGEGFFTLWRFGRYRGDEQGSFGILTSDMSWRGLDGYKYGDANYSGGYFLLFGGDRGMVLYDYHSDSIALQLTERSSSYSLSGRFIEVGRLTAVDETGEVPVATLEYELWDTQSNQLLPRAEAIIIESSTTPDTAIYLLDGQYWLFRSGVLR